MVLATNIAITKYKEDENKKETTSIEREIVRVPVKSIEDNFKKDNISKEPAANKVDKTNKHISNIKPSGGSKSF